MLRRFSCIWSGDSGPEVVIREAVLALSFQVGDGETDEAAASLGTAGKALASWKGCQGNTGAGSRRLEPLQGVGPRWTWVHGPGPSA